MINMTIGGRSTVSVAAHIGHNLEALRSRQKWLGSGFVDYALFAKPARKFRQFVGVGKQEEGLAPSMK